MCCLYMHICINIYIYVHIYMYIIYTYISLVSPVIYSHCMHLLCLGLLLIAQVALMQRIHNASTRRIPGEGFEVQFDNPRCKTEFVFVLGGKASFGQQLFFRPTGNSSRPAAFDLRRQAVGRRTYTFGLQHPEGVNLTSCASSPRWYANLCQDAHRKNYHARRGGLRYHRQRKSDP